MQGLGFRVGISAISQCLLVCVAVASGLLFNHNEPNNGYTVWSRNLGRPKTVNPKP